MVMSQAASAGGVFEREHLKILQQVFDQACIDRGYSRTGPEAEELALLIVQLFHAGFESEADLHAMLDREK
jgi:hypothetical protein